MPFGHGSLTLVRKLALRRIAVDARVAPIHSAAVAPDSVWEIVFLMVILKIPIVYLCSVVYYAIKAEPKPEEGTVAEQVGPDDSDSGGGRRRGSRGPRLRPHGGPTRSYPRAPRTANATARRELNS